MKHTEIASTELPVAQARSSLRSQSLRKRYKSRTVVQDVSLEVSSGEVVGLLGPNGAGKTTCFYMIVGLIPVVGDIIATALSLWVVREARALGAPWHLTARMLGNVAIQGVVGTVPVAGDAFDVLFRANMRNARLLRRWLERQPH